MRECEKCGIRLEKPIYIGTCCYCGRCSLKINIDSLSNEIYQMEGLLRDKSFLKYNKKSGVGFLIDRINRYKVMKNNFFLRLNSGFRFKEEEFKRKENRLTVVTDEGRVLELWDVEIEESIQDEGRTLKLFVKSNHNQQPGDKANIQGEEGLNRTLCSGFEEDGTSSKKSSAEAQGDNYSVVNTELDLQGSDPPVH